MCGPCERLRFQYWNMINGVTDPVGKREIRSLCRNSSDQVKVPTVNSKKPLPLIVRPKHDPCPVCGEISYSITGVHPQCAMRQADQVRLLQIGRRKGSQVAAKPVSDIKPWQKVCPKCKALQHVRKQTCVCGHSFPQSVHARLSDDDS